MRFVLTALIAFASASCSSNATLGPCEGGSGDACANANDTGSAMDATSDANGGVDAFIDTGPDDARASDASDAGMRVDVVEACTPSCGTRTCGDDGCGGVCGRCFGGSVCGSSGSCAPDPAANWIVEAVDGVVLENQADGSNWDPFGGQPDPFVCITINGDRQCSDSISDTLSPVWNFRHPMSASTSTLQSGIRFEVRDSDSTSGDDVVGDVMAMAADSAFIDPVWSVTVGRATVRVRLTVAP